MLAASSLGNTHSYDTAKIIVGFKPIKSSLGVVVRLDQTVVIEQLVPLKWMNPPMLEETLRDLLNPLMFDYMPVATVNLELDEAFKNPRNEGVLKILLHLFDYLRGTNDAMIKFKDQVGVFSDYESTLIYNCEGGKYLQGLQQWAEEKQLQNVFYEEFNSGWDTLNRCWGEFGGFSLTELITYLTNHQVARIVSVNMYYLQIIALREAVNLLALCKYIGIEYVVLEWDLHDINPAGGLNKKSLNYNGFVRFDIFPSLQKDWNDLRGFENIVYYPIQSSSLEEVSFLQRDDDYQILVAAHARLAELEDRRRLARVLEAFEFTQDEDQFYSFQFWFHAISYFLAKKVQAPIADKNRLRCELIKIHFDGISILKYEALEHINTERKVVLYGDQGWEQLFPEYYQGVHLSKDEMYQKLADPKYLNLHVNNIFSYAEANSVICDAIDLNAPFVGFPAVARGTALDGFGRIEYRNAEEMNELVGNVNEILRSRDVKNALNFYQTSLSKSREEAFLNIVEGVDQSRTAYIDLCNVQHRYFQEDAERYIRENQNALMGYLKNLNDGVVFPVDQSRLRGRRYMEVLLAQ